MSLLVAASAEDAVKFTVPGVTPAGAQPAAPAPAPAPAAAPAAPKAKYTDAQIVEAYGWYMAAQMGLRQLEFTKAEIEAMARGMIAAVGGGQPTFDPKDIGPELQAYLGKKNEAFMSKLRFQQLAEGQAFFTKLKENKNVVELPSGLRYEVLKPGTGAVAKPGQLVSFHYTGTLVSGQVFDSSVERGQPIELPLLSASAQSPNGVIAGVFEGLQKVAIGGKVKLYIPPSLGYGDEGSQAIPPGATLIFEAEVLGAKDAPKEPAAPAAK